MLRRRQTSGVVAVQANKTGSSLLLQMDTPIQPAVVIMRYDKCEKYNEQHQNEK